MKSIQDLIQQLQTYWSKPRSANHRGEVVPFQLYCDVSPPHGESHPDFETTLPHDLIQFWKHASSARLFKDAQYGQWGLEILSLQDAQAESARQHSTRPRDFMESDLVVGRFLGDSDLLVVRNDSSAEDFGQVLVALPIDRREDWEVAATSFSRFLERFIESEGDKYWE